MKIGLGDVNCVLKEFFPLAARYCLDQLGREEIVQCTIAVQRVLLFSYVMYPRIVLRVFSRMIFLEDLDYQLEADARFRFSLVSSVTSLLFSRVFTVRCIFKQRFSLDFFIYVIQLTLI